MSTRANIVLTDGNDTLWFYRHSDGYPEGAMPLLKRFMDHVKSGAIRDNACQAAGWLILFGHQEYRPTAQGNPAEYQSPQFEPVGGMFGWKCGAIEPTSGPHGDIEYLYTLNLSKRTIKTTKV